MRVYSFTVFLSLSLILFSENYAIFIILSLNKVFEYVEMTTFSRPNASTRIPRRFDFFV